MKTENVQQSRTSPHLDVSQDHPVWNAAHCLTFVILFMNLMPDSEASK